MIALCNFHNPSGAQVSDVTLREIANLARRSNAYVMVDEVYREMLFETNPQSSFHIDPERFIVTNSLTKAYGLSGLRCGWILAPGSSPSGFGICMTFTRPPTHLSLNNSA